MIWKPKSRADGEPAFEVASENDPHATDAAARRFGSEKHLNPDDASALAAQRAYTLQIELGMGPTEEKPIVYGVSPPSRVVIHKVKKAAVMFTENAPNAGGSAMISTCNQRTGRIPDPNKDVVGRLQCLWDKEVLPLDFSLLNFSDMEAVTRHLFNANASWVYRDEVDPVLGPTAANLNDDT